MAYGRQYASTRGANRLKIDQVSALNQQLQYLPERLAQQRAEQQYQDQVNYWNKSLTQQKSLAQKQREMEQREQQTAMGLEAAKLGTTISMGPYGQNTVSGAVGGTLNTGGSPVLEPGTVNKWAPRTGSGFSTGGSPLTTTNLWGSAKNLFGGLNFGNTIGAGLTGFGMGQMFSDKPKWMKAGMGAAAGGLMSLFTDGGSGISNTITGGIFGGLGSLF